MCLGALLPQAASGSLAPAAPSLLCGGLRDRALVEQAVVAPGAGAAEAPEGAAPGCGGTPGAVPHTDLDGQVLGKTKLCKYFARNRCSRGSACTFAHGRQELRVAPNLYKTELCFDFIKTGICHHGAECKYAHSPEELRVVKPVAVAVDDKRRAAAGVAPATVALAAAAPKGRGGKTKPRTTKDLSGKIAKIEREAQELRAQLRALQAKAAALAPAPAASPTRSGATSETRSPPAQRHSWASETDDDFGFDIPEEPAAAQPATATAQPVKEVEESFETEVVVKHTFFVLAPVAAAAHRSRSAPPARA